MNRFLAKEVVIHRRSDHWPRYPEYFRWCKANIGVRGLNWDWENGHIKRGIPDPLVSVDCITFQFNRQEDYTQFMLTHIL